MWRGLYYFVVIDGLEDCRIIRRSKVCGVGGNRNSYGVGMIL